MRERRLHRGRPCARRRRHRLLVPDLPAAQALRADRGPAGGGFPSSGKSDAIKKVNERNRIQIIATGAQIRALVNGKEVAKVTDSNPGQVKGRKVRFALGAGPRRRTRRSSGTFKRVAVSVPDP